MKQSSKPVLHRMGWAFLTLTGITLLPTLDSAAQLPAAPEPIAQATPAQTSLYENASYIGQCRQTNAAISVYADTALTQRLQDLNSATQVTLTGVLGTGLAQIREPAIGWLRAANLTGCSGGELPPKGTCYVLRRTAAPNGLVAYESPGGTPQRFNGQLDGPASGARIYYTNPPLLQDYNNRSFAKVYYTSLNGGERLGWVSQGPIGTVAGQATSNFAPCP